MSRASSTIPPLYDSISDSIKADEFDKTNVLNFFFTGQALIDGSQKNLPANNQTFTGTPLLAPLAEGQRAISMGLCPSCVRPFVRSCVRECVRKHFFQKTSPQKLLTGCLRSK